LMDKRVRDEATDFAALKVTVSQAAWATTAFPGLSFETWGSASPI